MDDRFVVYAAELAEPYGKAWANCRELLSLWPHAWLRSRAIVFNKQCAGLLHFGVVESECELSDCGRAPHILVADDDADIRELVSLALRLAGLDAQIVPDGAAALAAAEHTPRKVVVLDVSMPGVSGLDVCRTIKAREDGTSSILLLSANCSTEDVAAGYAAGADDYLTKPFSPRVLVARVAALLNRRRPDG